MARARCPGEWFSNCVAFFNKCILQQCLQQKGRFVMSRIILTVLAIAALAAVSPCAFGGVVTASYEGMPLVQVGDAGNTANTDSCGSVAYSYYAGQYDVTVDQYCTFLNGVAGLGDTYGLIPTTKFQAPGTQNNVTEVTQSGAGTVANPYTYAPSSGIIAGGTYVGNPFNYSGYPIFKLSWTMAARYVNWLDNGCPTGLGEVAGSTETGAYNLAAAVAAGGTAAAYAAVTLDHTSFTGFAIPTQQEWYKAAFYKGANTGNLNAGYFKYTTGSNTGPSATWPESLSGNTITVSGGGGDPICGVSKVNLRNLSTSPYGLYDAGGNCWQLDEWAGSGYADYEGGGYANSGYDQSGVGVGRGTSAGDSYPSGNDRTAAVAGLRVVYLGQIPEPSTLVLAAVGLLGLLCYAWRKRK